MDPPASPCSAASEDKETTPISRRPSPRKSVRGVSLDSILPDGVKRKRRKKIIGATSGDDVSSKIRPSIRKRGKKLALRKKKNDTGTKNDLDMVFVDAGGAKAKSDFIDQLNISAADERRKMLLQRLRLIDAKKAKLALGASGTNPAANESHGDSSSGRAPVIPALDISAITTRQNSTEDMARIGARLRGFASTASPDKKASGSDASPALSPNGVKRRASRCRTPSVLLRGFPGEGAGVFSPPGISQCKRLAFCKKMVNEMLRGTTARPFSAPVNELWPPESIPRYFDVITRPMDLRTVKRNLETGEYLRRDRGLSPGEIFNVSLFEEDVMQVFRNAMIYNSAGDLLYESAKRLLDDFEADMKKLPPVDKKPAKKAKKRVKAIAGKVAIPSIPKRQGGGSPGSKGVGKRTAKRKSSLTTSPLTPQAPLSGSMSLRQLKELVAELRKHRNYLELAIASPMTGTVRGHSQLALLYALEMTAEEKAELTENIAKLSVDKVDKLVAIIKNSGQDGLDGGKDGELEMDIDQFDNKLLRDLEVYVESVLDLARKEKGPKSQLETQYHTVEEVDAAIKAAEDQILEIRSSRAASKKERSFYDMQDSSSDSGSESNSASDGSSSESDSSDSE